MNKVYFTQSDLEEMGRPVPPETDEEFVLEAIDQYKNKRISQIQQETFKKVQAAREEKDQLLKEYARDMPGLDIHDREVSVQRVIFCNINKIMAEQDEEIEAVRKLADYQADNFSQYKHGKR